MKKLLLVIFVCILAGNPISMRGQADSQPVTLEALIKKRAFHPSGIRGVRSMDDGEHFTTIESQGTKIVKYTYEEGEKVREIFNLDETPIEGVTSIDGYSFNTDETKVLLVTDKKRIYRRSFTAEYYIYNRNTEEVTPLSENGRQEVASFSPSGNKVAFVRDNNLFITYLETGEEKQITKDGKHNHIINGKPDWVYEEEFEFKKAYKWSPDGKNLAYMKFDESRVKMWTIKKYKGLAPEKEENQPYPEIYTYKYPKAGEKNSLVSVHVYNLKSGNTKEMETGEETDQYIPRIRWTHNPGTLGIFRLNRRQNHFEILLSDIDTGNSEVMYEERNEYYIDERYFDYIKFLPDKEHFIITSEQDDYAQIYLYDMNGNKVRKLTKGKYDITDYYGYDAEDKRIYYQAAAKSPLRREVYSVNIQGTDKKVLAGKAGTNAAEFSNGFKYFINTYSSADTPPYITLNNEEGETIRVLEDNNALENRLEYFTYSDKNFFTFTTDQGTELNGWMIKPVDFDPDKEYPCLMTQYSGPNSQQVRDRWGFGWEQVLANQGYVIACVDGRGTGARGEEFRKSTYLELGKKETVDQIETAKFLGEKDFIDKERIGIWGWSYGGYMSLLCMTKGADYFDTGIAVAPVTNWRFYDNIYTERFMRKPSENPDGYDKNSPINHAQKLEGDLLICHGTADDNVHVQNTHEMSEALVQADKQFQMHLYTNRQHGIYGGNTRYHLYTKFVNFLRENLKKPGE